MIARGPSAALRFRRSQDPTRVILGGARLSKPACAQSRDHGPSRPEAGNR